MFALAVDIGAHADNTAAADQPTWQAIVVSTVQNRSTVGGGGVGRHGIGLCTGVWKYSESLPTVEYNKM